jgi:hypothetical protein
MCERLAAGNCNTWNRPFLTTDVEGSTKLLHKLGVAA